MGQMRIGEQVREFHETMGLPVRTGDNMPVMLPVEELVLRKELIEEELSEFYEALASFDRHQMAKEGADLIYVVVAALISLNIDIDAVLDQVHASNMTKTPGNKSPSGKILKGDGYKPPPPFLGNLTLVPTEVSN